MADTSTGIVNMFSSCSSWAVSLLLDFSLEQVNYGADSNLQRRSTRLSAPHMHNLTPVEAPSSTRCRLYKARDEAFPVARA